MAMNFQNASFLASYGTRKQLPPSTRMEVAFIGRSNVGKSSLINKLLQRKNIARVSSVPGKTATINFYNLDDTVHMVDLPGYGYAKVSKSEQERFTKLIQGYFEDENRLLELVVLLLDMRHAPSRQDREMVDYLIDTETPFVVVLTKADKLNKSEFQKQLQTLPQESPCGDQITLIPFSSETGLGVDVLRSIIEELALPDGPQNIKEE